ncbi:DUF5688 family protein [Lacrimispora brassicae]
MSSYIEIIISVIHFKNFISENCDLIILPSSVHEVLLLPIDNDIDFREFQELVKYVNQAEVAVEDRLSDNVYLYNRSIKKLRIAI